LHEQTRRRAKVAKDTGITKTNAAAVIDSIIDGITKALKKGDPVSFVGFGTFKSRNARRAPRAIRRQAPQSTSRSAACRASARGRR